MSPWLFAFPWRCLIDFVLWTCYIAFQETFKGVKSWIRELKEKGPKNIVIAIAGNKIDLEDEREVSSEGRWIYQLVQCLLCNI